MLAGAVLPLAAGPTHKYHPPGRLLIREPDSGRRSDGGDSELAELPPRRIAVATVAGPLVVVAGVGTAPALAGNELSAEAEFSGTVEAERPRPQPSAFFRTQVVGSETDQ